jgi:hypothetical protein
MKKATAGEINLAITIKESTDETKQNEPSFEEPAKVITKPTEIEPADALEWEPEATA